MEKDKETRDKGAAAPPAAQKKLAKSVGTNRPRIQIQIIVPPQCPHPLETLRGSPSANLPNEEKSGTVHDHTGRMSREAEVNYMRQLAAEHKKKKAEQIAYTEAYWRQKIEEHNRSTGENIVLSRPGDGPLHMMHSGSQDQQNSDLNQDSLDGAQASISEDGCTEGFTEKDNAVTNEFPSEHEQMMQYVAKKEKKKAEQRAENDAYYRRMNDEYNRFEGGNIVLSRPEDGPLRIIYGSKDEQNRDLNQDSLDGAHPCIVRPDGSSSDDDTSSSHDGTPPGSPIWTNEKNICSEGEHQRITVRPRIQIQIVPPRRWETLEGSPSAILPNATENTGDVHSGHEEDAIGGKNGEIEENVTEVEGVFGEKRKSIAEVETTQSAPVSPSPKKARIEGTEVVSDAPINGNSVEAVVV